MNPESVVVLAHGLRLVVSTLREEAPLAYRVISDGFVALTCLEAQTGAYNYAKHVYPAFADRMKKSPYLIRRGPLRGL